MELSGNKGEWSELYALFKMLSDGVLTTGDVNLNKIEDFVYPIVSIIRQDIDDEIRYDYNNGNVVVKTSGGNVVNTISISDFKENAESLLSKIKAGNSSFEIPEIKPFREKTSTHNIKASSSKKADIAIIVHDERTGSQPKLEFSIKSQLGSPATLLNSARNTNFIFSISAPLSDDFVKRINETESQQERLKQIYENGGTLKFCGIEPSARNGDMYFCNLQNIDTAMPEILGHFVLTAVNKKLTIVKDIVEQMTNDNPLNFNMSHSHTFYETKMKRFLTDVALGMKPGELWNGRYEANGGYIVVRVDGEIVCYHIYNKNEFEDYLYSNTKIDYPSRSRHDYGYVYKDSDGSQKIKLNFQIRFVK